MDLDITNKEILDYAIKEISSSYQNIKEEFYKQKSLINYSIFKKLEKYVPFGELIEYRLIEKVPDSVERKIILDEKLKMEDYSVLFNEISPQIWYFLYNK